MSDLAAPAPAAISTPRRRWELDALRGLMLVLMTSSHLPTWFAMPASEPFGFVSAAEGFVFLSAYMAGMVYTQRALRQGVPAMRRAFLRRAMVLYACQAASLLFLFTVIAALGFTFHQSAAPRLMWFYLQEPVTALWASLLLIYNPPLLDILPVYVIFMLLSPWVLGYALQRGWTLMLGLSVAMWIGAQFGMARALYDLLTAATGLSVPFSETGAFETYAWQLLWMAGLWLGARHARTPAAERRPPPPGLTAAAFGIAAVLLVWRHVTGHQPFAGDNPLNWLSDKWLLGPLRLLDFAALVIVLMYVGRRLPARLPRPRFLRWLQTLGSASLPVFCAHLVLVLLALAVLGDSSPDRPLWLDPVMFIGCMALLHGVARIALSVKSGPGGGKPASCRTPPRQGGSSQASASQRVGLRPAARHSGMLDPL
ncbi:hypothetical protein GCM10023144_27210 [Pigmentiphaga soli]|uniref:Acyltransferase n=1 Tax=Pigmentiphaga soli TaxID=1007095 RepID=A0ABP8H5S0_9BURK